MSYEVTTINQKPKENVFADRPSLRQVRLVLARMGKSRKKKEKKADFTVSTAFS